MKNLFMVVCLFFLLAGCTGPQGPTGPTGDTGATGPTGPAGTTLLHEYTGQFAAAGNYTLNVSEITGKRTTTFVMAYWAFSSVPDVWTPMTDGWLDSSNSRIFSVSWTAGQVYFYEMDAGDYYLVQVFQHN
ncbi:collagen-like protein [bacterium]|nr:collagen-like protein [bacterium]